jgi:hypothetical protein
MWGGGGMKKGSRARTCKWGAVPQLIEREEIQGGGGGLLKGRLLRALP